MVINYSAVLFPGNSVIILSIIKSKDLKGPTNLFLGSLAVADLLTVTICVPIRVSTIGFFTNSTQYKNANITNFVLAVPLERN